jgi:hypothetical protein
LGIRLLILTLNNPEVPETNRMKWSRRMGCIWAPMRRGGGTAAEARSTGLWAMEEGDAVGPDVFRNESEPRKVKSETLTHRTCFPVYRS